MLKPQLILAAVAALAAAPAMAQAPPPPAPIRMPPPLRPEAGVYDVQSRLYRDEVTEQARKQKIAEQEALKNSAPDRIARAEKVSALLNAGKCLDAAKLALDEGDKEMAAKVANICRKTASR